MPALETRFQEQYPLVGYQKRTHFFFKQGHISKLCYEINGNSIVQFKKMNKDVGMGLLL